MDPYDSDVRLARIQISRRTSCLMCLSRLSPWSSCKDQKLGFFCPKKSPHYRKLRQIPTFIFGQIFPAYTTRAFQKFHFLAVYLLKFPLFYQPIVSRRQNLHIHFWSQNYLRTNHSFSFVIPLSKPQKYIPFIYIYIIYVFIYLHTHTHLLNK